MTRSASEAHTFAVCAYGQSPFLTECLDSVFNQEDSGSEVYIATSTPSAYLEDVARQYGVSLYANDGESGIGQDWNFAYSCSMRDYVTIAHQDDIYCPGYAGSAVSALGSADDSVLYCCDYGELRSGERVDVNANLRVKRRLLKPLSKPDHEKSKFARWKALAFGSAICCPSVCLNKAVCGDNPFKTEMKCSLDWDTWETLSHKSGGFYYAPEILMYHRIHEESATTKLIENNTRSQEDRVLFGRLWPRPIAAGLAAVYSRSLKSNEV